MEGELVLRGVNGLLRWQERSGAVMFEAEGRNNGSGIYKVYILSAGRDMPLGSLVPEGDFLRFRRAVPMVELVASGCWPPERAEARCVFAFRPLQAAAPSWAQENAPQRFLEKVYPNREGPEFSGVLSRQRGGVRQLAFPFDIKKAFPLLPIFCFARTESVEGAEYVIFSFDGSGNPIFPA